MNVRTSYFFKRWDTHLYLVEGEFRNLDPDNAAAVTDLICELAKQHESTLLMVTHDRSLLEKFDRTVDVEKEFQS